jgi:hypothetical protein
MKGKSAEQIIEEGTVREKILLYFEDMALRNVDVSSVVINNKAVRTGGFLDAEQEHLIVSSVKAPKDLKYYNQLRHYDSLFNHFILKYKNVVTRLRCSYFLILGEHKRLTEGLKQDELFNELLKSIDQLNLEEIYRDIETKQIAVDVILRIVGKVTSRERKPKLYTTYWKAIQPEVYFAIDVTEDSKLYIKMFKRILSKDLPIKAYREWVKAEETGLKNLIESIYSLTTALDNKPEDFPVILRYEEVEVDITEEDVTAFKNNRL